VALARSIVDPASMQQRISLEDAALLASVVTEGGLSAAARSLGMPKSTLSRRLRGLQDEIGVVLFSWQEGAFRPTEAGVQLSQRFAAVIEEAEEAHHSIADAAAKPTGAVRILAPASMGPQLVGDLVAGFLAKHAEVTAEVELVDAPPSTVEERFDVVLQLDASAPDPSVIARRLGGLELVLCASPGFLAAHGAPSRPEELSSLRAVAHGEELAAAAFVLKSGGETTTALCPARLTVNQLTAVHRAVLMGLGIGALPLPLVHADLQAGRLVRVLPEWELPLVPLCAQVPSRRHLRPVVRALLDHVSATLRELTDPAAGRIA
jgi:DNA-binding transcriptional LysR family regulator